MAPTGHPDTKLVILRGNSASGKSTTAQALRVAWGRGVAWVEQDNLRRIVLREHDIPLGVNIGLIDQTVRYALDHRYHVILEGILDAGRYGAMLRELSADHRGLTRHYYFDISLAETLRRHDSRPLRAKVSADQLRDWFRPNDLLPSIGEELIPAGSSVACTVRRILADLGLPPG